MTTPEQILSQHFSAAESRLSNSHDSFRLFHGRGHIFPGLEDINIDWHSGVVLVTAYSEAISIFFQAYSKNPVIDLPQILQNLGAQALVLQERYLRESPSQLLWGELPDKVYAHADGLKFQLNFLDKQNIGYFMDMQPGHHWLQARASNANVLNLFAYTCAFSVYARQAGASAVVNIDMSGAALNRGALNHMLNNLSTDGVRFLPHNIFKSLRKLKQLGPYDVIVIDPPSNQKGSFVTRKDYARLLKHLPEMMAPGCEVLACLNMPALGEDFLKELFAEFLPQCQFIERLPTNADYPEADLQRNLKILVYRFS